MLPIHRFAASIVVTTVFIAAIPAAAQTPPKAPPAPAVSKPPATAPGTAASTPAAPATTPTAAGTLATAPTAAAVPAPNAEAGFKGDPCANVAIARAIAGTDKAPQEECAKKLSAGGLKGYAALLAGMRNSAKELAKAGLSIKLVHLVPSIVVIDAVLAAKAGVVGADGSAPKAGAHVKLPLGTLIKKKA